MDPDLKQSMVALVLSDHYQTLRDYLAYRRAQHAESVLSLPPETPENTVTYNRGRASEVTEFLMVINGLRRELFAGDPEDYDGKHKHESNVTQRQNKENVIMCTDARKIVTETGKVISRPASV